jgi:signal transduction histidine kinase
MTISAAWHSRIAALFGPEATSPAPPRPARLRRGRVDLVEAADLVVALICFAATDATLRTWGIGHGIWPQDGVAAVVSAAVSLPLALRTRFPFPAWLISAAAMLAAGLLITRMTPFLPAGVIVSLLCLYAVTVRCRPGIVAGAAVFSLVGAALLDAATTVAALVLIAIPVLSGAIVRSRRSSRRQLAVAEQRHSSERALLEERQRIARELHDVVAHHMSVIAIAAEAAPYKTAEPPPELVESFADIRASALSGLDELRRVLGVLRGGGADTAPQPGLADLEGLLDSARAGGVRVSAAVSGAVRPIPQGVDLSAYRIVQEALSNALRYAPGSQVLVALAYQPGELVIEVRNGPAGGGAGRPEAGAHGGGHGLVGMRERTAMLGGTLAAGPAAGGGFAVTAALPLDREAAPDLAKGPP